MSFTARFRGWCAECDGPIEPGEEVVYRVHGRDGERDELMHVKCPETVEDKLTGAPCPRCTVHHAGEC